jgi:hypothetical protein
MPKNLSTVGGATKLRFGKNCREDQAENSIVFNASEEKIDATGASGVYITPLELASEFAGVGTDDTTNTFVAYNQSTHQLFRTQVPLSVSALSGAGGTSGDLTVTGNLYVSGNVTSVGTVANLHVTNTTIKDGLVEIGTNNTDLATFDLGHILNRGPNGSNVAVAYDASATELVIGYTNDSAMEVTQVTVNDAETMNVHVYGKLYANSNIGAANTAPVHTLSVGTKCFIEGDGNHSNVIEARGNTYTTGNVYVEGGLITNTGGVTKKTYSHQGTYATNASVADATLTLTFSRHAFYAKIVAQLLDNLDTEVSTMTLDIAGGERGGDTAPLDIAMGPMSIFGKANDNPWSSAVTVTPTTVAIEPSIAMSSPGNYTVFVEYISRNTAGELTSLTVGTGSAIPFGY